MKRKIILSILLVILLACPVFGQATRWNINQRPTANWWTGAAGLDLGWEWMKDIDALVSGGMGSLVDTGCTIYYVDNNNGLDTYDGLSWSHAFLTIGKALETSHTNISESGKGRYANRNRIYVKGDDFDEDWTDLAQKTDIIGVGSDDGNKGPRILGNHTIDPVASGYNYMGCRFINMTFLNQAAADIFVVPTGHHGLEWIGCRFESNSSVLAPTAIDITQCSDTRIVGCEFISSVNPMWASGAIDFGAGLCQNTDILGNFIDAAIGITIDSSASGLSGRIEGNTIHASTLTIDDNSDVFFIVNNTLVSEADFGVASYDFTDDQSAGNILRADNGSFAIPRPANDTLDVGTVYYVDGETGSNNEDGLSWITAFDTIQTAVTAASSFDTIYIRNETMGAFDEAVTTATDVTNVSIIGVGAGKRRPVWRSGVAGSSHLTINARDWTVKGIMFQGLDNTVAHIVVDETTTNNGSGFVIEDCYFHGGGNCHSAIQITGGVVQGLIKDNIFVDYYTKIHTGFEATVWGDAYTQAAVQVDVIGNSFIDCLDSLSLQAVQCIIKGNLFTKTGHVQDTTTVINTVGAGGAGGANIVTGNVFDNMTYEIDNAHGYYGNTKDVWSGNICPDGLTIETYPRAGAATTEQDSITPQIHLTSTVTSGMTDAAGYGTGDSPVEIFTVTGDILCRAFAVIDTLCTSTSNDGTLELGVVGNTALLLVQDAVAGTGQFDPGDVWTKTTPPTVDILALLPTEWMVIGGGADIDLVITTNNMTAGVIKFYLQWIPMSADAQVVGAAP